MLTTFSECFPVAISMTKGSNLRRGGTAGPRIALQAVESWGLMRPCLSAEHAYLEPAAGVPAPAPS